jgi:MFS family permease
LISWSVLRFVISLLLGGYYVASVSFMVGMFPPAYRARLQALNSGMFSLAEIALGAFGATFGDAGWHGLMWIGAIPPMLFGCLVYLAAPNDRKFVGFGEEEEPGAQALPTASGWAQMLSIDWRWLTISCIFLAGLNFIGYQLFSSFVTVYLRMERGFDATAMGALVAFIGTGSLAGGFFWAWIADRFGRRAPRWGFVLTSICVLAFLAAPADPILLTVLGAAYGFGVSCTYSWGVYFTEIFPRHLRPYGAALFHGGHIISIAAPILTTEVSAIWGLGTAMALSPIAFLVAVAIWSRLPETIKQQS